MDNLETIMQDKKLVKKAMKEYLLKHCPHDFKLKDAEDCNRSFGIEPCKVCWTEALKNQD